MRFSGTEKCYALSVWHQGDAHHWRISYSEQGLFQLDSNVFSSLQKIVDRHKVSPIQVFQLLGTGTENVNLTTFVPRIVEPTDNNV